MFETFIITLVVHNIPNGGLLYSLYCCETTLMIITKRWNPVVQPSQLDLPTALLTSTNLHAQIHTTDAPALLQNNINTNTKSYAPAVHV
jgi:hypothetical protein